MPVFQHRNLAMPDRDTVKTVVKTYDMTRHGKSRQSQEKKRRHTSVAIELRLRHQKPCLET